MVTLEIYSDTHSANWAKGLLNMRNFWIREGFWRKRRGREQEKEGKKGGGRKQVEK